MKSDWLSLSDDNQRSHSAIFGGYATRACLYSVTMKCSQLRYKMFRALVL